MSASKECRVCLGGEMAHLRQVRRRPYYVVLLHPTEPSRGVSLFQTTDFATAIGVANAFADHTGPRDVGACDPHRAVSRMTCDGGEAQVMHLCAVGLLRATSGPEDCVAAVMGPDSPRSAQDCQAWRSGAKAFVRVATAR